MNFLTICSLQPIGNDGFIFFYLFIIFIKNKIMEKIKSYLPYVTLVLVLFTLIRSCGTGSELSRMNKSVNQRLDSIEQSTVTKKQLEETLKNTPLWKTLEIEELSDKDHMPINHYKNEEEKN